MSDLSNAEKKVLGYLLRRAADEFSNHGCNDLHLLKDAGLTAKESYEFRVMVGKDPNYTEMMGEPVRKGDDVTYDWAMYRYLADKIDPGGKDD